MHPLAGQPVEQPADRELTSALASLRADPDAVPADLPAGTLDALVAALSSADPGLRDDLAASTLVRWIAMDRLLTDDTLRGLHRRATAAGGPLATLGDQGSDTVFGRSFTILLLALLHAADNAAPYLDDRHYRDSLAVLTRVGRDEQDLRAQVPGKGWAHMIAHAADLADELAQSGRCTPAAAHEALAALSGLVGRLDHVFLGEEEDRIAVAVTSLITRGHASVAGLRDLAGIDRGDPMALPAAQRANWKAVARSLFFRLPPANPAKDEAARLQQDLTAI
jgi:uncharacterized protein DUF2785